MFCDGPVWQSAVLSLLVPETRYMFCCNKATSWAADCSDATNHSTTYIHMWGLYLLLLFHFCVLSWHFLENGLVLCILNRLLCLFHRPAVRTTALWTARSIKQTRTSQPWHATYSLILLVSFFSLELFVLAPLAKLLVFFFFFSCSSVLALTCATCDVVFVLGTFYNSDGRGP